MLASSNLICHNNTFKRHSKKYEMSKSYRWISEVNDFESKHIIFVIKLKKIVLIKQSLYNIRNY